MSGEESRPESGTEKPIIENPFPVSERAVEIAYREIFKNTIQAMNLDAINAELSSMDEDDVLREALDELSKIRTGLTLRTLIAGKSDQDPNAKLYKVGAAIVHRALAEEAQLRDGVLPRLDRRTPDLYKGRIFHLRESDLRLRTYQPIAQLLPMVEGPQFGERLRDFTDQEPSLSNYIASLREFHMLVFGALDTLGLYRANLEVKQPVLSQSV